MNKVEAVIKLLEETEYTYKQIALETGYSVSTIEKINRCKMHTDKHSYELNIRQESRNLPVYLINNYSEDKKSLYIKNRNGLEGICYFDIQDYDKIKQYKWCLYKDRQENLRVRCSDRLIGSKDMANFLLGGNRKEPIDHIDRNTLNNRRDNLRKTTNSVNSTNARPRSENKSGIRGVYRRAARPGIARASWVCEWGVDGKRHSKSFSVDKYGEEEAFRLASVHRKEKLQEMKI